MSDGMTAVQRLELAGYVAPALRRVTAEKAARRVKLVKNGTWEETGEANLGDALKGLAKIHELEHAVADGQRPKVVLCESCGKSVEVKRIGHVPKKCIKCNRGACADCGTVLSKGAKSMGAKRCRSCAGTATDPRLRTACVDCGNTTWRGSTRCKPCNTAHIRTEKKRCVVCAKELVNRRASRCKRHALKRAVRADFVPTEPKRKPTP